MAARLRRAEPAFADRSLSGPAKSGLVPAVRVPTGEAPAVAGEVAVSTSSRSISLRGLPKPDPIPIRGGTTPDAAAVPPGPTVPHVPADPFARPPEAEGRPARRGAPGLGWSGFASVLLHLGVALPFLVDLPSRDMPPAGGDAETFAVEIVAAGDAEADRLARSGATPAPEVAAVPSESAAIAATPPELSMPPDDAPAAATAIPVEPVRTPVQSVPLSASAAEAADPSPPTPERPAEAVAPEGERTVEARTDPAAAPQPARQPSPVAPVPENTARSAAPAPSGTGAEASDPPPHRAPTAPARPDHPPARARPPATTATAQPAPAAPRSAAPRPSRAGADRPDGGTSAATSRAGAAAPRGDGQAGAEVLASYRNRVLAHLARHKQYPDSARDRGIEGRVAVTFTLSASGQVVTAALAGSSGHPELDRITLATVQRASPFPPIPPGGPATMTFRTALRYDLR